MSSFIVKPETRADRIKKAERIIAKFKIWFGAEQLATIFSDKVEYESDGQYVTVYRKEAA